VVGVEGFLLGEEIGGGSKSKKRMGEKKRKSHSCAMVCGEGGTWGGRRKKWETRPQNKVTIKWGGSTKTGSESTICNLWRYRGEVEKGEGGGKK